MYLRRRSFQQYGMGAIWCTLPDEERPGLCQSHWMLPSGNYSLCIAKVAAMATTNITTIKKCISFAGHFDGHGNAPVQYHADCPMEEVHGFPRSHWMPPLGKYLLG
jgi:hypothetical protein